MSFRTNTVGAALAAFLVGATLKEASEQLY
jgi:hypothetical protein